MDIASLRSAIKKGAIEWQRHAFERMIERSISRETVKEVLISGDVIEDYEDDKPYPSALFCGKTGSGCVHVVAAFDSASGRCSIITVYKPDLEHFEADFRTRRKK